jgi:dCMP deaminase
MENKFIDLYMDFAKRVSELSYAKRLKVGSVIVKNDTVISYGYNGTPSGWDNNCEYKEYDISRDFNGNYFPGSEKEYPLQDERGRYRLKTKPEVLHAERNALDKLAKRGGVGGAGASIFITHAPCMECAKSIFGAGVKEVFYAEEYRSKDGVYFLEKCGVKIEKISHNDK